MWLYSNIKSLGDIPRYYAAKKPESVALIDEWGSLSFRELDEKANQFANLLLKLEIRATDRIAFIGKNSNYYFITLLGSAKIGASHVPLNWRLAAPEMASIVEDCSPSVIIADREYEALADIVRLSSGHDCPKIVFDSMQPGTGQLDDLMNHSQLADPMVKIDRDWTVLLLYTSGTTGKPKGVQLSHDSYFYIRLCEHLEPSLKYEPNDVMLTVMPLFHAFANQFSFQALYHGATVLVYSMPPPAELMQLIKKMKPTIVPLVPTALQMILNLPNAHEADYSSVRLMIYAGSSIEANLLAQALREIDCKFLQLYGATETGGAPVALLRPEDHELSDVSKLKSCGKVLPLIDMKVVDANDNELPDGQVGEFLIHAPTLATGYFNQPAATAIAFKDGWYRSGDSGYRDSGGYFFLVDRVKDMIISGGENVYSTEVEHAILRLPGVQLCAAVGLPDKKWGERVVAVIQKEEAVDLSQEQVIAHCRTLIAGYKVPKQVIFVEGFPMTTTGKVKKRELRGQLLEQISEVTPQL